MINIIFGIFLFLHGIVHLLYAGQSIRLFELQANMTWPDGSWLFSKMLGVEATRTIGGILLVLIALGLIAGGLGMFFKADWARTVAIVSAVVSTLLYLVCWDGHFATWSEQGGVGILLNIAVIAAALILK
jgi:hypothetical protein